MKIKNMIASFVAGASLLTMVGGASAAITGDINIYGASAQYNFWKGQAVNFLNAQGCTNIQTAQTTDNKNFIAKGTCGGNTRYFRSSSKASYDGPLAVQSNSTNANRTASCDSFGYNYRNMLNEAGVGSWGTTTVPSVVSNATVTCKPVTGGASDVQVTSFQQESHGMLLGPSTSTANVSTDRNFKTSPMNASGLNDCRPLIVPFSFYVNKGVTAGDKVTTAAVTYDGNGGYTSVTPPTVTISAPTATLFSGVQATATATVSCASGTNVGCKVSAINITNTGSGYLTNPTVAISAGTGTFQATANAYRTVTNLTTAQARLLFSQSVGDWADMGFDAGNIRVCWRHAGSGTAAALDFDVMRPAALGTTQATLADSGNTYSFWFNDGAADEMACVNGDAGGVGYADADQSLSIYPNSAQVTYNDVAANKANIVSGMYDFYTVQNLYTANPTSADMTTLCNFMKVPANNTNAYYASICELKFVRAADDLYSAANPDYPCQ